MIIMSLTSTCHFSFVLTRHSFSRITSQDNAKLLTKGLSYHQLVTTAPCTYMYTIVISF